MSISRNLEPILPPEDDESVAVLVVEPNAGIAHALEDKFYKKQNLPRLFVLNCAIAGPPEEVDSLGAPVKFGRQGGNLASSLFASLFSKAKERLQGVSENAENVLTTIKKKNVSTSHMEESKTVPVFSLGTILHAVPKNVTLEMV